MSRVFILDLEPDEIKFAENNAATHGNTLKYVLERTVKSIANKGEGEWATQKQLEGVAWCPDRVTLLNLRTSGVLIEGEHYKLENGRFIFYNTAKLKKLLKQRYKNKFKETTTNGKSVSQNTV